MDHSWCNGKPLQALPPIIANYRYRPGPAVGEWLLRGKLTEVGRLSPVAAHIPTIGPHASMKARDLLAIAVPLVLAGCSTVQLPQPQQAQETYLLEFSGTFCGKRASGAVQKRHAIRMSARI
jgi:hypothetical protein